MQQTCLDLGRWSSCSALRGGAGVVLAVLLSGCLSPVGDGTTQDEAVLKQTELARGQIVLMPPEGYCVQRDSLQRSEAGGFALIASCAQLTGKFTGYKVPPVVMTVSAVARTGEQSRPSSAELEDALRGQSVLHHTTDDAVTVAHVEAAEPLSPEGDRKHWRGVMALNGYLVGLALYGAKGSPEVGLPGRDQLMKLAKRIRNNSPSVKAAGAVSDGPAQNMDQVFMSDGSGLLRPQARPGTPVPQQKDAQSSEGTATGEQAQAKPILGNLFRRIFN